MTAIEDLEQGDVEAFRFITGSDGSLTLETAADNPTVLVKSDAQVPPEATPVSVTARVEKVIRSDGAVDCLVLDVMERDDSDTAETTTKQPTADAPPGSLDSIAEDLVSEVQVRRRERDERSTVVIDAAGERDRADAKESSERERKIRGDARDPI